MNVNYLKKVSKTFLICLVSVFMFNCSGDDGADGLNGADGTNGAEGAEGLTGAEGINGVGFDEFAKYGSITTTVTGTRPDDVAFTDVAEFKFLPIDESLMYINSFERDGDDIYFNITRFPTTSSGFGPLGASSVGPESAVQGPPIGPAGTGVRILVEDAGLSTQSFDLFNFYLSTIVIGDDLTYFSFQGEFDNHDYDNVENLSITNFSFDDVTNELIFSYSFDVDASDNYTGNDLTVSGEVSVIVLESLDGLDFPPFEIE